jgi:hypothetical protein
MRTIKIIVGILGLSLLLCAFGSVADQGTTSQLGKSQFEGKGGHGQDGWDQGPIDHDWNSNDRDWKNGGHHWNNERDWLSSGGHYWYPKDFYYTWYTQPYYYNTYYPTYYYTEPVYPSFSYHDSYLDPWWNANTYSFSTTYYSSGYY